MRRWIAGFLLASACSGGTAPLAPPATAAPTGPHATSPQSTLWSNLGIPQDATLVVGADPNFGDTRLMLRSGDQVLTTLGVPLEVDDARPVEAFLSEFEASIETAEYPARGYPTYLARRRDTAAGRFASSHAFAAAGHARIAARLDELSLQGPFLTRPAVGSSARERLAGDVAMRALKEVLRQYTLGELPYADFREGLDRVVGLEIWLDVTPLEAVMRARDLSARLDAAAAAFREASPTVQAAVLAHGAPALPDDIRQDTSVARVEVHSLPFHQAAPYYVALFGTDYPTFVMLPETASDTDLTGSGEVALRSFAFAAGVTFEDVDEARAWWAGVAADGGRADALERLEAASREDEARPHVRWLWRAMDHGDGAEVRRMARSGTSSFRREMLWMARDRENRDLFVGLLTDALEARDADTRGYAVTYALEAGSGVEVSTAQLESLAQRGVFAEGPFGTLTAELARRGRYGHVRRAWPWLPEWSRDQIYSQRESFSAPWPEDLRTPAPIVVPETFRACETQLRAVARYPTSVPLGAIVGAMFALDTRRAPRVVRRIARDAHAEPRASILTWLMDIHPEVAESLAIDYVRGGTRPSEDLILAVEYLSRLDSPASLDALRDLYRAVAARPRGQERDAMIEQAAHALAARGDLGLAFSAWATMPTSVRLGLTSTVTEQTQPLDIAPALRDEHTLGLVGVLLADELAISLGASGDQNAFERRGHREQLVGQIAAPARWMSRSGEGVTLWWSGPERMDAAMASLPLRADAEGVRSMLSAAARAVPEPHIVRARAWRGDDGMVMEIALRPARTGMSEIAYEIRGGSETVEAFEFTPTNALFLGAGAFAEALPFLDPAEGGEVRVAMRW